jgi:hypothetical protein
LPSNGQTIYTSDNQVWTPQGLKYVSFLFAHDNSIPSQTSFRQGELIGHTGTAGGVGDHVHIDKSLIANDVITNYGIYCGYGNLCYALGASQYPVDVFYISGNETIVETLGNNFQTIPDEPGPPEPPPYPPWPPRPSPHRPMTIAEKFMAISSPKIKCHR